MQACEEVRRFRGQRKKRGRVVHAEVELEWQFTVIVCVPVEDVFAVIRNVESEQVCVCVLCVQQFSAFP